MQHQPLRQNPKSLGHFGKVSLRGKALHLWTRVLIGLLGLAAATAALSQEAILPVGPTESVAPALPHETINRVIDGLKEAERAQYLYERIERLESRKLAGDADPQSVKVSRVVPAGTGITKIGMGPDGKPTDADSYRAELERLLKTLTWATQSGQPQRDAYQRVQKKQKERDDLIDATRNAFMFTFAGHEQRGDRMLSKYSMEPNPSFKPTNRTTSIFSKVKGNLWVDDASQQLARVEGEITDDISLGLFLAKVHKGSHFMQDRYEMAPGVWLPTFTQYDFDGRKFFSNFAVHEKTFYSDYKRIGPPGEAIPQIQSELARLNEAKAKPAAER